MDVNPRQITPMPGRVGASASGGLAPYACDPFSSRGRVYAQPADRMRTAFQRDRDRIVHSGAFRRLVYKTQVFLNHEGDLFRTRLTHSLEVAQLVRSIARTLRLNEDLVEAIALAHDLGHTPFGHAGQDALHECMARYGGFEHNLQSLRVVDELEDPYPDHPGLNLCFETREGILKHCARRDARRLGEVGRRFLDGTQPSLEAQLCNLADEIAYNTHDLDDGVRSGLLKLDQLQEVPLCRRFLADVHQDHPSLTGRRLLLETLRRMLSAQVFDVVDATRAAIGDACPASPEEVRQAPALARFSEAWASELRQLKAFLRARLYRHPQVIETTQRAQRVVRELFALYLAQPSEMPADYAQRADRPRAVADYVAGMTDRFALREHERLTGGRLFE